MDRFEKTAGELMELVCDRCRYMLEDLSPEEAEDTCELCPVRPAIAAALLQEHTAGRLAASRQLMKAAEAVARE